MRAWLLVVAFICLCTGAGRWASAAQPAVATATPAGTGDTVVILGPDSPDDASLLECVAGSVQRARPDLSLLPAAQFRDALFPYFERSTLPKDAEGLSRVLARPEVKKRLGFLHIRYMAVVRGMAVADAQRAAASYCVRGPCLGLMWWDREATVSTATWDLPFPVPDENETGACAALARRIVENVTGAGAPSR